MTTIAFAFIVAAYLIGSLSFAVIVTKLLGVADPRTFGSKNPGATNVLRSGNKLAAALTLLGDGLKGWLAVFLALHLAPRFGLGAVDVALVAMAVTIGHMWPVFFRFKGGKGVATAAGVLFALYAPLGLAVLAVWIGMAVLVRISSLSALVAAISAPLLAFWLLAGQREYIGAVIVIALLLIHRHKQNIMGLLAGQEGKIGEKAKAETK